MAAVCGSVTGCRSGPGAAASRRVTARLARKAPQVGEGLADTGIHQVPHRAVQGVLPPRRSEDRGDVVQGQTATAPAAAP